ncbi:hypothetical protein SAMN05444173_1658 [Opitutus sp. GAS368]|nr:hypothetical protein SAMN05444173_1658 [Opitutus sp. GAS368]
MLVAVCLAAFCGSARGEETGDLRATIARLEKAVAELSDRVAALESKPQAKPEAPKPPEGPEEVAAGQGLAAVVHQQSQGAIELTGFRKTDGLMNTEAGVQHYVMSFEADIRCNAQGIWRFMPALEEDFKFQFAPTPRKMQPMDEMLFYSSNPGARVARGAGFRLQGKFHFERAENGWRITRIEKTGVESLR